MRHPARYGVALSLIIIAALVAFIGRPNPTRPSLPEIDANAQPASTAPRARLADPARAQTTPQTSAAAVDDADSATDDSTETQETAPAPGSLSGVPAAQRLQIARQIGANFLLSDQEGRRFASLMSKLPPEDALRKTMGEDRFDEAVRHQREKAYRSMKESSQKDALYIGELAELSPEQTQRFKGALYDASMRYNQDMIAKFKSQGPGQHVPAGARPWGDIIREELAQIATPEQFARFEERTAGDS